MRAITKEAKKLKDKTSDTISLEEVKKRLQKSGRVVFLPDVNHLVRDLAKKAVLSRVDGARVEFSAPQQKGSVRAHVSVPCASTRPKDVRVAFSVS